MIRWTVSSLNRKLPQLQEPYSRSLPSAQNVSTDSSKGARLGTYTAKFVIDAALVRTVTTDKQRQQIVKSILALCEQLNVKVVAEGVETKEQVQMLHDFGCEYFQGFYFSRSLSCDCFIEYVKQHGMKNDC